MQSLSVEQEKVVVEAVVEVFGHVLTRSEFVEASLGLFEDIPGFEIIPPERAQRIINQLWSIYDGKKSRK